jgi:hypothetical protein
MLNEGDRVRMEDGVEGVIILLFPDDGSALVLPDLKELPFAWLPLEKLTRIAAEPKQPR